MMTKEEKAKLYDQIVKRAYYKAPDYGYHNGGWVFHVNVKGEKDCPRSFTAALKKMLEEE